MTRKPKAAATEARRQRQVDKLGAQVEGIERTIDQLRTLLELYKAGELFLPWSTKSAQTKEANKLQAATTVLVKVRDALRADLAKFREFEGSAP